MGINYKTDTNKGYYSIINKAKYYPSGKIPIISILPPDFFVYT